MVNDDVLQAKPVNDDVLQAMADGFSHTLF